MKKNVLVYELEGAKWLLIALACLGVCLALGDYWFAGYFGALVPVNVWVYSRLGAMSKGIPAGEGIGGA